MKFKNIVGIPYVSSILKEGDDYRIFVKDINKKGVEVKTLDQLRSGDEYVLGIQGVFEPCTYTDILDTFAESLAGKVSKHMMLKCKGKNDLYGWVVKYAVRMGIARYGYRLRFDVTHSVLYLIDLDILAVVNPDGTWNEIRGRICMSDNDRSDRYCGVSLKCMDRFYFKLADTFDQLAMYEEDGVSMCVNLPLACGEVVSFKDVIEEVLDFYSYNPFCKDVEDLYMEELSLDNIRMISYSRKLNRLYVSYERMTCVELEFMIVSGKTFHEYYDKLLKCCREEDVAYMESRRNTNKSAYIFRATTEDMWSYEFSDIQENISFHLKAKDEVVLWYSEGLMD